MPEIIIHTEEYYNTHDIDWFAIINGVVVHVASAGGLVPEAVKKNLLESAAFVSRIALIEEGRVSTISDGFISERLGIELGHNDNNTLRQFDYDITKRDAYLSSFLLMARRGLFSFDKTDINDPTDNHYHIVAWPSNEDDRVKLGNLNECPIPVLNGINLQFDNPESLEDVDFTPLLWKHGQDPLD